MRKRGSFFTAPFSHTCLVDLIWFCEYNGRRSQCNKDSETSVKEDVLWQMRFCNS